MSITSDEARARINEAAKELLDARSDAEFSEAARAMAAVLEFYGVVAK